MFIRFLIAEGRCSETLIDAIPTVANWRLSSLPHYLSPDDVERVIKTCDTSTPSGIRGRAILLLLARLGLRAGDVIKMRLADINWKRGTVMVSGKGRRQVEMPLSKEVGDAIVAYIRHARPTHSSSGLLFLSTRAPVHELRSHSSMPIIVSDAMRKTGVASPGGGAAHVLRRTLATTLLRQGTSLQDIATVLRHRSIQITQIYAKVDVHELRQIAQPWPEVLPC